MNKKYLFFGGIFGPVMYFVHDVIGGIITPHYSFIENTISDLTKTGARDTYLLGAILLFISALLGIAFGLGIILHYRQNRLIFFGGLFLAIIGLFNIFTATIFPQDPLGGDITFPGTMHVVLVGISIILIFPIFILMAHGLYRVKGWKSFRLYTFISLVIIFISGIVSVILVMNDIALMGLFERISVYTIQIWTFILAYNLIKERSSQVFKQKESN